MVNKPPSSAGYTNILTVIDEFSRYPFAFPTKDRSTITVIKCLQSLFQLFGPPKSIHSDRGPEFFSKEMGHFLSSWSVHQSRTTPYNPSGNGQCERFNGIIWRTVLCILAQNQANLGCWPDYLGEALHCVRSLHCSSTGLTPHNRLLAFVRRTPPIYQPAIPAGDYVWLRRFVRHKNDPTGELVQIVAAYPNYAVISHFGATETDTVNWRHLARHPGPIPPDASFSPTEMASTSVRQPDMSSIDTPATSPRLWENEVEPNPPLETTPSAPLDHVALPVEKSTSPLKTRSGRAIIKPDRYGFS